MSTKLLSNYSKLCWCCHYCCCCWCCTLLLLYKQFLWWLWWLWCWWLNYYCYLNKFLIILINNNNYYYRTKIFIKKLSSSSLLFLSDNKLSCHQKYHHHHHHHHHYHLSRRTFIIFLFIKIFYSDFLSTTTTTTIKTSSSSFFISIDFVMATSSSSSSSVTVSGISSSSSGLLYKNNNNNDNDHFSTSSSTELPELLTSTTSTFKNIIQINQIVNKSSFDDDVDHNNILKPLNFISKTNNHSLFDINNHNNNLFKQKIYFIHWNNESINNNRKQKRDSNNKQQQQQPQYLINGNKFWNHAVTSKILRQRRSRRLTHLYSSSSSVSSLPSSVSSSSSQISPSSFVNHLSSSSSSSILPSHSQSSIMMIKTKQPKITALSSIYSSNGNIYFPSSSSSSSSSSSALHSSSNAAVSGQQNRLKILLNPPPAGFGANLVPNKKCNFEIYPSGCFDENGSICDNDGMCICRPGYLIRIANLYCLRPSFIGEACYTTEQCERKVINSGCFNYREEYREENPSAFFGPSQSSWPMGECRCRIGHRFDEKLNACVRSIIGSWCSNVWDCEMADEDLEHIESGGSSSSHRSNRTAIGLHQIHFLHSSMQQQSSSSTSSPLTHSALTSTNRNNKMANLVCENNICNCSQFFYYNQTAEECQYIETYGNSCQLSSSSVTNSINKNDNLSGNNKNINYVKPSKRSIRFRNRRSRQLIKYNDEPFKTTITKVMTTINPLLSLSLHNNNKNVNQINRLTRSLIRNEFDTTSSSYDCNYPTICSINKTCICADGYEYQSTMIPKCQRIGGQHYTHYYHSGSSIIRTMKGSDGYPHDRLSYHEGTSNVANFFEYVLYFLVPGLIIIFIFKPCFRRIGEWRNHIHQYQSDSDFYLTTNNGRPVIAEMSVIGPQCSATGVTTTTTAAATNITRVGGEKIPNSSNIVTQPSSNATTTMPNIGDIYSNEFASFAAFAPHLVYHNAYLFDTTDPCYATPIGNYGYHTTTTPASTVTLTNNQQQQQQQAASMALVKEKLQTIEESQSEDGSSSIHMNNFSNSNSINSNNNQNILTTESCVESFLSKSTQQQPISTTTMKSNDDQSNDDIIVNHLHDDQSNNNDDDNENKDNNLNKTNNNNIIDFVIDNNKSNRCDSNIINNNNNNDNNNEKCLNILYNNNNNGDDHNGNNNDHHSSNNNHIAEST